MTATTLAERQPRERDVLCSGCFHARTWHLIGVCDSCRDRKRTAALRLALDWWEIVHSTIPDSDDETWAVGVRLATLSDRIDGGVQRLTDLAEAQHAMVTHDGGCLDGVHELDAPVNELSCEGWQQRLEDARDESLTALIGYAR